MHEEEIIYDFMRERDELQAEVERLRAELEKERMRLAVCGVVAMSNTKESLSKVMAEIHPDYLCASVDDVKRAVKREIELRAELAAVKAEIESVIRLGPHPVEQVQMPLATFVRSRMVARWEYNAIIDKLEKAETELAAAKEANVSELNAYRKEVELLRIELGKKGKKAASVCPVKFDGVFVNSADEAVVWFEETGKAEQFADWLRKMKEQNLAN